MGRTGTTRRHALILTGAAATALLTGCSTDEPEGRRTAGSAPDRARAEAALRRRLAATSGALRDQYDAVIRQHPALAGQLNALRAAVAEHVTALGGTTRVAPPVPVPADAGAAVKALAAAERRTSDAHTAALVDAEPELARLLASVAAAGAAHAYLLTKGGAR
ncbi:hypothetical protein OG735_30900 [Streptomyces sp. NBC_01210]|uniref:hypothetical protein n=1 Tax=Streptomyces sp. NBC_01210 TaxID=2903774 RepID=UPI002E0FBD94|nr:hypothetical protein OG735_30900 [Streptomyces sp. NBC_01210]